MCMGGVTSCKWVRELTAAYKRSTVKQLRFEALMDQLKEAAHRCKFVLSKAPVFHEAPIPASILLRELQSLPHASFLFLSSWYSDVSGATLMIISISQASQSFSQG
jgi:hypothetical protein